MKNLNLKAVILLTVCCISSIQINAQALNLTKYVDPFIGATGEGHTFPGASLPYGMVKIGPDCGQLNSNSGYDADGKVKGVSHVHVSGTGGPPKYGNILVAASTGKVDVLNYGSYRSEESATSGYYAYRSKEYNLQAAYTVTHSVGFHKYIKKSSRKAFRELCLLSPKAVLRGMYSAELPFKKDWVGWKRDEFLDGIYPLQKKDDGKFEQQGMLKSAFEEWYKQGNLLNAVDEKYQALKLWKRIAKLSKKVKMENKDDQHYIRISSEYGLLLQEIIAEGWNIMALGYIGDQTGNYEKEKIKASIAKYDKAWEDYKQLKDENPSSATLYKPYAWRYNPPTYHGENGMDASVNKYREIINATK